MFSTTTRKFILLLLLLPWRLQEKSVDATELSEYFHPEGFTPYTFPSDFCTLIYTLARACPTIYNAYFCPAWESRDWWAPSTICGYPNSSWTCEGEIYFCVASNEEEPPTLDTSKNETVEYDLETPLCDLMGRGLRDCDVTLATGYYQCNDQWPSCVFPDGSIPPCQGRLKVCTNVGNAETPEDMEWWSGGNNPGGVRSIWMTVAMLAFSLLG